MPNMSEFLDNLMHKIWMNIYQGLWDTVEKLFEWTRGIQSDYINKSRDLITQSPKDWNATAYSFVEGIASNAVIPIAGCIITFVFCWQIISMVQESNQMHNIKPETMLLLLIKLIICLFICSKSIEIVNGMFGLAAAAVEKISLEEIESIEPEGDFERIIGERRDLDNYSFSDCGLMLMYVFITLIALLITYVISITIYIRVNMWYLELLIYTSAAPMPFATFMNKEWGQVGTNYSRKMLAMSFEGFFMLVTFGLYSAMTAHVLTAAAGNNTYLVNMITVIGCGAGLVLLINKAGNISASIFNAH